MFSFLLNQLSICPLPQVLKFPPGTSYIERTGFSFIFPYVWDPMIATLYALRTLPSFKWGAYCTCMQKVLLYQLVNTSSDDTWNQMKAQICTVLMFLFQQLFKLKKSISWCGYSMWARCWHKFSWKSTVMSMPQFIAHSFFGNIEMGTCFMSYITYTLF